MSFSLRHASLLGEGLPNGQDHSLSLSLSAASSSTLTKPPLRCRSLTLCYYAILVFLITWLLILVTLFELPAVGVDDRGGTDTPPIVSLSPLLLDVPAWIQQMIGHSVCPSVAVDIREQPHLPVATSASYLHQFNIKYIVTWETILHMTREEQRRYMPETESDTESVHTATQTAQVNDSVSNRAFPFPWYKDGHGENVLHLSHNGWTVRDEDTGYWFYVLPSVVTHARSPVAITPIITPGTSRAADRQLRHLDDLSEIKQRVLQMTGKPMDYDDRRGPVWPLKEWDLLPRQNNSRGWWVFGEAHLIWQSCSAVHPPTFHDSRTSLPLSRFFAEYHHIDMNPQTVPALSTTLLPQLHSPSFSLPSNLRILILVISTRCNPGGSLDQRDRTALPVAMKHAYARFHGYDALTVCRTHSDNVVTVQYEKMNIFLEIFRAHASFLRNSSDNNNTLPTYDYFWFHDWDTVIMNASLPAEAFLPSSLPDHVYTDHHFALNDGSFLMRLNPRMYRFATVWQQESFEHHDWAWSDNGSWNHLIVTFLDRSPPYFQQCPRINEGPPYPILICIHLTWMEDHYQFYYHHRFSQYQVAIPAQLGFNNHNKDPNLIAWGWMTSAMWQDNHGMFMQHGKDYEVLLAKSNAGNTWDIKAEDYEVDRIHINTRTHDEKLDTDICKKAQQS